MPPFQYLMTPSTNLSTIIRDHGKTSHHATEWNNTTNVVQIYDKL